MGRDFSVCVSGGDRPHIGGTALAWVDEPMGEAIASAPGHREVELAEEIAVLIRDKLRVNVAVVCGIHYDGASPDDIRTICQAVREMALEFVDMS